MVSMVVPGTMHYRTLRATEVSESGMYRILCRYVTWLLHNSKCFTVNRM
jgi:hypothetical protein